MSTKGEVLEKLNAALVAVDDAIYSCNFGVEAAVPIGELDGVEYRLAWRRYKNRWSLCIENDENLFPIAEAKITLRLRCVDHLDKLLAALHVAADDQFREIHAQTAKAWAFAFRLKPQKT